MVCCIASIIIASLYRIFLNNLHIMRKQSVSILVVCSLCFLLFFWGRRQFNNDIASASARVVFCMIQNCYSPILAMCWLHWHLLDFVIAADRIVLDTDVDGDHRNCEPKMAGVPQFLSLPHWISPFTAVCSPIPRFPILISWCCRSTHRVLPPLPLVISWKWVEAIKIFRKQYPFVQLIKQRLFIK